jgi:hypothetical protein
VGATRFWHYPLSGPLFFSHLGELLIFRCHIEKMPSHFSVRHVLRQRAAAFRLFALVSRFWFHAALTRQTPNGSEI